MKEPGAKVYSLCVAQDARLRASRPQLYSVAELIERALAKHPASWEEKALACLVIGATYLADAGIPSCKAEALLSGAMSSDFLSVVERTALKIGAESEDGPNAA